jgi:hypothetical protein
LDRDGTEYGINSDSSRYRKNTDGTRYDTFPGGAMSWSTLNGTKYQTLADGTKLRRGRNDFSWLPDSTRVDPPDMTLPRRGGIIAVGLEHLPKFKGLAMSGAGAHGLYGPNARPSMFSLVKAPPPGGGHSAAPVTDSAHPGHDPRDT